MKFFSSFAVHRQRQRELPAAVEEVRGLVAAVLRHVSTEAPAPRRWGQIMIFGGEPPGFYSLAFELVADAQIVKSEPFYAPVPAGSWVVAVGCRMSQVMVGNQLQDVGSGVAGIPLSVLRLSTPIDVGVVVRAGVVPYP